MTKRELIARNREAILALAAKHGATNVRVFGSAARGDDHARSDVDFFVRFPGGATLRAVCGLAEDFEALLGCTVDVLTDHPWIRARLRRNIEQDAVAV